MTDDPRPFLRSVEKKLQALPRVAAEASTPQEQLLQAAKNGQFEALVRAARPAEPVVMITPEEREAELRAAGRWPTDKPQSTSPVTRGRPGEGRRAAVLADFRSRSATCRHIE